MKYVIKTEYKYSMEFEGQGEIDNLRRELRCLNLQHGGRFPTLVKLREALQHGGDCHCGCK